MSNDQIAIHLLSAMCVILLFGNGAHVWIHRGSIKKYKALQNVCRLKEVAIESMERISADLLYASIKRRNK